MKKFSIIALTLMLALAFASCSKQSMKDQMSSEGVNKAADVASEKAKVASCKSDADKAFDACVKKAGKDKKKAAACDTAKTKAYADCEKK